MLIGDTNRLENKTAIICDDMCDSGGTLIKVLKIYKHMEFKMLLLLLLMVFFLVNVLNDYKIVM